MQHPTPQTYGELQQAYDHFNSSLFENELPPCLITLQRERRTLGYFSEKKFISLHGEITDEIAMNPVYFAVQSLYKTLSTLVHEMVHLWQSHFGKPGRGRYHNKEWASKMIAIGLVPSDTGEEGGKQTGDCMTHYILEDGPFHEACSDLITQEFTLSWYDRFPPPAELPSFSPRKPADIEDNSPLPDLPFDPEEMDSLGFEFPDPDQEPKVTGRIKYRCPECRSQVWGKPNLSILCGACGGIPFNPKK